eukprot:scaffold718_cov252-Pinguiococcus_pyrenoidosus.AAC.11
MEMEYHVGPGSPILNLQSDYVSMDPPIRRVRHSAGKGGGTREAFPAFVSRSGETEGPPTPHKRFHGEVGSARGVVLAAHCIGAPGGGRVS